MFCRAKDAHVQTFRDLFSKVEKLFGQYEHHKKAETTMLSELDKIKTTYAICENNEAGTSCRDIYICLLAPYHLHCLLSDRDTMHALLVLFSKATDTFCYNGYSIESGVFNHLFGQYYSPAVVGLSVLRKINFSAYGVLCRTKM